MSTIIRPVLRPIHHPSLLSTSSHAQLPTYTCILSRHARLLRRPKRPYTFTQLVTLSDGSAFTMRTTSPAPVYRSTRDTRNSPLWNPSSRELANVEDDEAGRLAGFRARFGLGFDAVKTEGAEGEVPAPQQGVQVDGEKGEDGASARPVATTAEGSKQQPGKEKKEAAPPVEDQEEYYEFEEDDANLLDLISSYGQAPAAQSAPPPKKGKK